MEYIKINYNIWIIANITASTIDAYEDILTLFIFSLILFHADVCFFFLENVKGYQPKPISQMYVLTDLNGRIPLAS